jgi:hypothetical protein
MTRPAATAKLAFGCTSADEFDSRMSALADLLGHLSIALPAQEEEMANAAGEKSLMRLRRKLSTTLEAQPLARASSAVDALQAAVRIRVAGQHTGVGNEVAGAFERLGVRYPPRDWGVVWEEIRSRCAAAVDTIREELEAAEQEQPR